MYIDIFTLHQRYGYFFSISSENPIYFYTQKSQSSDVLSAYYYFKENFLNFLHKKIILKRKKGSRRHCLAFIN